MVSPSGWLSLILKCVLKTSKILSCSTLMWAAPKSCSLVENHFKLSSFSCYKMFCSVYFFRPHQEILRRNLGIQKQRSKLLIFVSLIILPFNGKWSQNLKLAILFDNIQKILSVLFLIPRIILRWNLVILDQRFKLYIFVFLIILPFDSKWSLNLKLASS